MELLKAGCSFIPVLCNVTTTKTLSTLWFICKQGLELQPLLLSVGTSSAGVFWLPLKWREQLSIQKILWRFSLMLFGLLIHSEPSSQKTIKCHSHPSHSPLSKVSFITNLHDVVKVLFTYISNPFLYNGCVKPINLCSVPIKLPKHLTFLFIIPDLSPTFCKRTSLQFARKIITAEGKKTHTHWIGSGTEWKLFFHVSAMNKSTKTHPILRCGKVTRFRTS